MFFNSNEILIFKGSTIQVLAIKNLLLENSITSIIKDHNNSAILAGFGAIKETQLFVNKKHEIEAIEIVKQFLDNQNFLHEV